MHGSRVHVLAVAVLLPALFISRAVCQAIPDSQPPKGLGLDIRFSGDFGGSPGLITFSNIPQSLRTVPSNQNGPQANGTPVTIPGSTFVVEPNTAELALDLAPQVTFGRITLRGGASLVFPGLTSGPPTADGGPYQEINQYGTSMRGTGTSLVYYSLFWGRTPPSVSPYGEVELRLVSGLSLLGGYVAHRTEPLVLQNGWDQYDALSVYTTNQFALMNVNGSAYGAVRWSPSRHTYGILIGAKPVDFSGLSSSYSATNNFQETKVIQCFVGIDASWTFRRRH